MENFKALGLETRTNMSRSKSGRLEQVKQFFEINSRINHQLKHKLITK